MIGKEKSPPAGWETVQLVFQIYGCIPPWIDWQRSQRSNPEMLPTVRSGINFSIILCAACYLEGFFEKLLLNAVDHSPKPAQPMLQRLLEDLRGRTRATMGTDNYNRMLELVLGKKASAFCDEPTWETIRMLFLFRNMLAHGRAVDYKTYWPPSAGGVWVEEEFEGNYAKVENYLLRKGLLQENYIRQESNWHYFQDGVADHFWDITFQYASAVEADLAGAAASA